MTRPDALTLTTGTTAVLIGAVAEAFATAAFFTLVFFFAAFFLTAFLATDFFFTAFFGTTFFLTDFFLTTFFTGGFFVAVGAGVAECAAGRVDVERENIETIMAALESNFFTPPLSRVHPRILGITRRFNA